jgi:hypothetical protein
MTLVAPARRLASAALGATALAAALALATPTAYAADTANPAVFDRSHGGLPISADGSDPKTWDRSKDGVLAAPQNHKVLYEDGDVRVLLVNVAGGNEEPYHLHPYWSVLLSVAMQPTHLLNRDATGTEARWRFLDVMTSPVWLVLAPPTPLHSIKNLGATPDRDIRIDLKQGAVPTLTRPDWGGRMPISNDGSDPKTWDPRSDATRAAASTNRIIYEDSDIRVQAVTIAAGAREPERTYPFPSVLMVYGGEPEPQAAVRLLEPHRAKADTAKQAIHAIRVEYKRGFPIPPA